MWRNLPQLPKVPRKPCVVLSQPVPTSTPRTARTAELAYMRGSVNQRSRAGVYMYIYIYVYNLQVYITGCTYLWKLPCCVKIRPRFVSKGF